MREDPNYEVVNVRLGLPSNTARTRACRNGSAPG